MKTGACLCGAVKYEVHGETTQVTYCHCSRCRRWHGHAGAYAAVDRPGLVLVESRALKWFSPDPAVKRGFCSECGSTLFFDEVADPKIGFTAGTVDAPTGLTSKAHIYVGSKGDYYEMAEDGLLSLDAGPP